MRKKFAVFGLCAILATGTLGLCACTPTTTYHNVLAISSNMASGGTVSGSGSYKNGSTVTLEATPKKEGGFLAWVQKEKIVSYEQKYSFIANSKTTEGTFTALFETDSFEFGRLEEVEYQLNSFTTVNHSVALQSWSLKYNIVSDLFQPLASFANSTLDTNDNNFFQSEEIEHEDLVFYSNTRYFFSLTMNLEYTNNETSALTTEPVESQFAIDFANIFSEDAVLDNGTTTYVCPEYSLELTPSITEFGKEYVFVVNYMNLKKSQAMWDNSDPDNNQQIITMTFIYKNPLI